MVRGCHVDSKEKWFKQREQHGQRPGGRNQILNSYASTSTKAQHGAWHPVGIHACAKGGQPTAPTPGLAEAPVTSPCMASAEPQGPRREPMGSPLSLSPAFQNHNYSPFRAPVSVGKLQLLTCITLIAPETSAVINSLLIAARC